MEQNQTTEKSVWIEKHYWKASGALRELNRAKKQRVADYDERIRLLKGFEDVLYIKSQDEEQGEMFSPSVLLSPKLIELMDCPLKGLD